MILLMKTRFEVLLFLLKEIFQFQKQNPIEAKNISVRKGKKKFSEL